jgi:cob(I)alamin adenosyltransferase
MGSDITVEILKQIRDGITSMHGDFNERLDHLRGDFNERLDATNERLDGTNGRLERVEQGLLDLGQFMRQIALDQSRHERFHTQHVDLLERDVDDLKDRVAKLEKRRGS